jgi:hypothetical protein
MPGLFALARSAATRCGVSLAHWVGPMPTPFHDQEDSMTRRTTISIAHRLSTLRDADMLAVIDGGKVVEYGTHAELIQKKGEYYNLFKLQSEALKLIGVGD